MIYDQDEDDPMAGPRGCIFGICIVLVTAAFIVLMVRWPW